MWWEVAVVGVVVAISAATVVVKLTRSVSGEEPACSGCSGCGETPGAASEGRRECPSKAGVAE